MGSFAENLLIALLAALASGALLAAFNWRRLRNWLRHSDLRPPDPSHFTILVADLDGDTDGRQTGHVVRALEGQEGIRVLRDGRCLKVEEMGDRAVNVSAAMARGRRWLSEKNADVLIWGEATEANKVLHLRLLGEGGSGDGAATGYALGDTYDLPENFGGDFGEVLVAVALAPSARQQSAKVTTSCISWSRSRRSWNACSLRRHRGSRRARWRLCNSLLRMRHRLLANNRANPPGWRNRRQRSGPSYPCAAAKSSRSAGR